MSIEDLDFETRKLCSDGSCIGVIGDDGRCKECGRGPASDEPMAMLHQSTIVDDHRGGDEGDDSGRELCPDGACIGLIDESGHCKECGKPREWSQA